MAELRATLLLLAALLAPLPALAQAPPGPAPGGPAPGGPPSGRGQGESGNPTQLLFDAIAIGNIDIVRDAIARGANLNNRNVLGQRPVDLAIDVGRSDIAFLLLSLMRGGGGPAPDRAAPAAPPGPAARAAPRRGPAPVLPAAPPRTPPLWANDGGAPMPELGFLGFDASRPEGVRAPPGAGRTAAPAPARRGVSREPLGG